ncbi:MAG TPA: carbon-nitrogen hydrolase family protein [Actinopolymorphaceae bacterium]
MPNLESEGPVGSDLTIALVQQLPAPTPAENLVAGLEAVRRAADVGADLVLFPEMWQIGYRDCPADLEAKAAWLDQAIDLDDPWLEKFRTAAAESGIAVAVSFLQKWPGRPRNAMSLIDRFGRTLFTYAKVHTCDFWWEAELTPGEEFHVAPLDTRNGTVQVGAMICYDREFPESARLLMLKGAEVVLIPNACYLDLERRAQVRTRAFENMTAMAMANYPAPFHNGHSSIYDAVSTTSEGWREQLVVEADETEQLVVGRIDLGRLRAYRGQHIWGNAYRRPHVYADLIGDEPPKPPFVRVRRRPDPTR